MATSKTEKEQDKEQEQEFVYSKPLVAFQQNQCGPGDPSLIPTPEENLQRAIDAEKEKQGIEDEGPVIGTHARVAPEKPKPTAAAGEQQANGIRPVEETIPPGPQQTVASRSFHPDPVKEEPKPNQDLPKPQPDPKPKEDKEEKKEAKDEKKEDKWFDKLTGRTKYKA